MGNTSITITVKTLTKAPVEKCWKAWISPADILLFNNPFPDWHTARVALDFRVQGKLYYRMEANDDSTGFDFGGQYDEIITHNLLHIQVMTEENLPTLSSKTVIIHS